MSVEAANAFRAAVDGDAALQDQIREQAADGAVNLLGLATERGYEFTAEELRQATEDGELSDFELEVVAGGFLISTINSIKSGPD